MKDFYKKYILPRMLNSDMQAKDITKERPGVVEEAAGEVLEIGFGSGLNLPFYKNVKKLYALEPSFESYDLARVRMIGLKFPVEYLQASAEKIPLPDNSVDTVISTWNFCSISEPMKAFNEIKRVLKPGGKYSFIDHGKSPRPLYFLLQNLVTPVSKNFTGNCHLNRDIENLIKTSSLQIIKLENHYKKWHPLSHTYKGVAVKQA